METIPGLLKNRQKGSGYPFPYRNCEWLFDQYIVQQKSKAQIARDCGATERTIIKWLRVHGIKSRSVNEQLHINQANHCQIPTIAKQFIEGEILGDMHIGAKSEYAARISYGSKYRQYLEWLDAQLQQWGIFRSGRISRSVHRIHGNTAYHYTSRYYEELMQFRNRFYPMKRKIVPLDLKLSPLLVRQWYIGDGSLRIPKDSRPYCLLHTCGFPKQDVKTLGSLLERAINITIYYLPSSNSLRIPGQSCLKFLDYIGPCPKEIEDIYGYKWWA